MIFSECVFIPFFRPVTMKNTFDVVYVIVSHQMCISQVHCIVLFPNMQLKLLPKVQKEIISELQTMQQLQEILDVVEIVMGFLSSGGANAKKSLKDYIKTTLKMEHKFSSKKVSIISFSVLYLLHSVYFWNS